MMKNAISFFATVAVLYLIAALYVSKKAGEEFTTVDEFGNHVKDSYSGKWTDIKQKYFPLQIPFS